MDKTVNFIEHKIRSAFGEKRIISLLFFGTRAFKINVNKFSDYDLVLLLDDWKNDDPNTLRTIVTSPFLNKADINLSLLYKSDIETRGINNFQLRSLGLDFYRYLSGAKILIGNNYFKENPIIITAANLKKHADFKIQESYGRCDKLYMNHVSKPELTNKIKKYSREMLRWILITEGKLSIAKIKNLDYQKTYKIAVANKYINNVDVENLESDNLNKIETTRRNIYLKYLDLFYRNMN